MSLETLKRKKIACLDLIQYLAGGLRGRHGDSGSPSGLMSSDGMSTYRDALEVLAKHGRFTIISSYGRQVSGYIVGRDFELIDCDAAVRSNSPILSLLMASAGAEQSEFQLDEEFKEMLVVLQDYVMHWLGAAPMTAPEPGITTLDGCWLRKQILEILASYRLFRIVRRTGNLLQGYLPECDPELRPD